MAVASKETPTRRTSVKGEPVSIALGKRLKALRIAADKSQTELAFDCELDRTYVSLIERGLANPSLWTLGVIAHVLKMTVPDLFEGNRHTVLPSAKAGGVKRRKNQASHEEKPKGTRRSHLR